MKKALLGLVVVLGLGVFASCSQPTQCKCTVRVGNVTVDEIIIDRPENKKCKDIKKYNGDYIDIDLDGLLDCVNYHD